MQESAHLWLFFAMVCSIVLLPGLDMALVLASSLIGGRRAGLAARPAANAWLARGVGALMLATAAYTAFEGWRLI